MRGAATILFVLCWVSAARGADIVFVAGGPSHGFGAHEYRAGSELLAEDLRAAGHGVVVVDGWPESPGAFDGADGIVLFLDGGGGHPVVEHLAEVEREMSRGVGLMAIHYAVEVPKGDAGEAFEKWIGGFYESGWSTNPHWRAKTSLAAEHPIASGVEPFEVFDEWYFNVRFRDDPTGVVPILTAVPDDDARSGTTSWPRGPEPHITEASGRREALLWAVERATELTALEPGSITKRLDRWFRFDRDEVIEKFDLADDAR